MAESKKKNKKNKKNKNKKISAAEKKERAHLHREVIFVVMTGMSLLLLIGNFGMAGKAGEFTSHILFGLFGVFAYIFPILLFLCIAFNVANPSNKKIKRKILSGVGIFIALLSAVDLITSGYKKEVSLIDIYTSCKIKKEGGGLIGAAIIKLLYPVFGKAGSIIIILGALILGIVFITEKSALNASKSVLEYIKKYISKKHDELKKTRSLAKEERIKEGSQKKIKEAKPENKKIKLKNDLANGEIASDIIFESSVTDSDFSKIQVPESIPINRSDEVREIKDEPKKHKKKDVESRDKEAQEIEKSLNEQKNIEAEDYIAPDIALLKKKNKSKGASNESLRQTAELLTETLSSFGVSVTVTNISCGPSVTRYELQPEQGVKVSKIVNLADDIKLNLAAPDIRIEAPIPGKAAVGIEVPNKVNQAVMLRELLESKEFTSHKSKIACAIGKDIGGKAVVADIKKMPHVLIAGATGSGKSVCINSLIMSILYKARPDEVKLIMIDPKVVELSVYNGIPHLMIPVVTDPKKASGALNWAVIEMTKRYDLFAQNQVRDIEGYNQKVLAGEIKDELGETAEKMPQLVIIVDELADLMMVASGEVEESICRLAQLARAAGIHLVLATQRPSVNVITGLIKANMPSRIAFSVSSGVDSRTIIDMNGAEKLLGKGDMLFYPQGYQKPVRVQGAFVSDDEVGKVVDFLIEQNGKASYNSKIKEQIDNVAAGNKGELPADEKDEYFKDAAEFMIGKDTASIGSIQRVFKVGFNRAARIMEQLCEAGIVSESEDKKPRKVLMNQEELENYFKNSQDEDSKI